MGRPKTKTKTEKIIDKLILDRDYWEWEEKLKAAHKPIKNIIGNSLQFLDYIQWKNIHARKDFSKKEANFLDCIQSFEHFCHRKLGNDSRFIVRALIQQILFGSVDKTLEPKFIRNYFSDSGAPFVLIEIKPGVTQTQARAHITRSWKDLKKHFRENENNRESIFQRTFGTIKQVHIKRLVLELASKTRKELQPVGDEYKQMAISRILKEQHGIRISSENVRKIINIYGKKRRKK